MKKLVITLMIAVAASFAAQATPVTTQEAMQIAQSFSQLSMRKAKGVNTQSNTVSLAYTADNDALYVFNRGGNNGFVIVSGEDATSEVLGYTDNGSFDFNNMPEGLKEIVSGYVDQVEAVRANPETNNVKKAAPAARVAVAPLVKTKWDQGEYYNAACPTDCLTGCVATALAQIMTVHGYPTTGQGEHTSVKTQGLASVKTSYANFGATTYDWDNMTATLDANSTEAEVAAVSTLLGHVGVAVDMQYTAYVSNAMAASVPNAMVTYFNYDKGINIVDHRYYTDAQWNEILYNELAAGRPVMYGGMTKQTGTSGHAFVVDGYAPGDYFHINWGYSGNCDGYFLLSALKYGINTYSFKAQAIIGIQPAKAQSEPSISSVVDGNIIVKSNGRKLQVAAAYGIHAMTNHGEKVIYGLKAVNEATGESFNISSNSVLSVTEGSLGSFDVTLGNEVADGKYLVSVIGKNENASQWVELPVYLGFEGNAEIEVSGNNVNVAEVTNGTSQVSASFEFLSSPHYKHNFEVRITLTNNGDADYLGQIQFYAGTKVLGKSFATVSAGETVAIDMVCTPNSNTSSKYSVKDLNGALSEVVEMSNGSIDNVADALDLQSSQIYVTEGNGIQVNAVFANNSSDFFDDEVIAEVRDKNTKEVVYTLSKLVTMDAGSEREIVFNGVIDNAMTLSASQIDRDNYEVCFVLADGVINDESARSVEGRSSVPLGVESVNGENASIVAANGEIVVSSEVANVMVFALNGTMVASSSEATIGTANLNAGIYVVKAALADGRVITSKVMVK